MNPLGVGSSLRHCNNKAPALIYIPLEPRRLLLFLSAKEVNKKTVVAAPASLKIVFITLNRRNYEIVSMASPFESSTLRCLKITEVSLSRCVLKMVALRLQTACAFTLHKSDFLNAHQLMRQIKVSLSRWLKNMASAMGAGRFCRHYNRWLRSLSGVEGR